MLTKTRVKPRVANERIISLRVRITSVFSTLYRGVRGLTRGKKNASKGGAIIEPPPVRNFRKKNCDVLIVFRPRFQKLYDCSRHSPFFDHDLYDCSRHSSAFDQHSKNYMIADIHRFSTTIYTTRIFQPLEFIPLIIVFQPLEFLKRTRKLKNE